MKKSLILNFILPKHLNTKKCSSSIDKKRMQRFMSVVLLSSAARYLLSQFVLAAKVCRAIKTLFPESILRLRPAVRRCLEAWEWEYFGLCEASVQLDFFLWLQCDLFIQTLNMIHEAFPKSKTFSRWTKKWSSGFFYRNPQNFSVYFLPYCLGDQLKNKLIQF